MVFAATATCFADWYGDPLVCDDFLADRFDWCLDARRFKASGRFRTVKRFATALRFAAALQLAVAAILVKRAEGVRAIAGVAHQAFVRIKSLVLLAVIARDLNHLGDFDQAHFLFDFLFAATLLTPMAVGASEAAFHGGGHWRHEQQGKDRGGGNDRARHHYSGPLGRKSSPRLSVTCESGLSEGDEVAGAGIGAPGVNRDSASQRLLGLWGDGSVTRDRAWTLLFLYRCPCRGLVMCE